MSRHGVKVVDKDGNEITSPDGLGYMSRAYLQAIRNHTLAFKLENGELDSYLGIPSSKAREAMEEILDEQIDGGIHGIVAACHHFELITRWTPRFEKYETEKTHGMMLTEKGWEYLEKWGL